MMFSEQVITMNDVADLLQIVKLGFMEYTLIHSKFIQASKCKIQELFKDFLMTFLLFSRTENL